MVPRRAPARLLGVLLAAQVGLLAATAAAQGSMLPSLDDPAETWADPAPTAVAPEPAPLPPVEPVPPAPPVEPAPAPPVEPAPLSPVEPVPPAPEVAAIPPAPAAAPVLSTSPSAPAPAATPVAPVGPARSSPPAAPVSSDSHGSPAPAPAPARADDPRRWRHGGLVVDLQLGTTGCLRRFCSDTSGNHAAPGVHLGAFIGGNIAGIVEVGLETGWNTLRPRDVVGQNAMTLYGLDPALVSQAIAAHEGVPASTIDFSSLDVISASSRAFDIGPSLKVHFIRKGRGLAYVGAGAHYQLWRNRYSTPSGDLRLDFHGITAPLKLGGGAYVHKNIALVGEFTYSLAFFVLGGVKHPYFSGVAPLSAIEGQASAAGSRLAAGLPHFWTLALNLRFRF